MAAPDDAFAEADDVPVGVPLLVPVLGVVPFVLVPPPPLDVPMAFALNASKVLAELSLALIDPTIPSPQWPVWAQKNQKGVVWVI